MCGFVASKEGGGVYIRGSPDVCSERSCMRRDESLPGLGSRGEDAETSGSGLSSSRRNGIVGDGGGKHDGGSLQREMQSVMICDLPRNLDL